MFSEIAVSLVPAGKIRCVVTDKLLPDKPEEHVRQRIARSLMDNYKYDPSDIEVEFAIKQASRSVRVDLAIFPPGVVHKQENIKIIVECKQEGIKPTDKDNGIEQLKSYISACLNVRFGMWVGSELQVWEKIETPTKGYELLLVTDIPRFGEEAPAPLTFQELVPAQDELSSIFKRCHNYIYGNQGFQKEAAFQELLKVIFCKVYDEQESTGYMRFFIDNESRRSEIGQKQLRKTMEAIFEEVKKAYPYIFSKGDEIKLENRVLAYIAGEFQRFSLLDTTADVKGAAYEQLVGANLRGDRGEFFTPRVVCHMAVEMILATYPKEDWLKLRAIDPTCGTGGFLREMIVAWHDLISEQQSQKWKHHPERIQQETKEKVKKTANQYLMGIDFNPVLVRAAQMNLVMHGDGSTNVYQANSLLPPGEWPANVRKNIIPGSFDVVITNPPFGAYIPIDDTHILNQFELTTFEAINARASIPPEQLFIERCLYLLKPGGRLAIVLPDSVLSNPGLAWLRRWILQKARLIASIDLPQETFEPYTGTQTSLLLLQKKSEQEIANEKIIGKMKDYEVFMSTPQAVGHDRRGNPLYLRTPEGELIEYDKTDIKRNRTIRERIIFNQLLDVVTYFRDWWVQKGRME